MKKILIRLIIFYQKYISPWKKQRYKYYCKFYPTCSQYAMEAIERYGPLKGSFMAIKRILRCHPFSKGGYDPVK
ncbi:membrane protein insertion efficiency factor YidD [Clostridium oryzae]|uniref:membrane protein insertion efficiency factor YidD n=1 Tax=Clostridium oryzae TaxID=1450648 RepID=UPI001A9A398D|nr:membrane protein insertion efficiency factor YidD [Clostridium oryzae]